jgi:hypothetical protein
MTRMDHRDDPTRSLRRRFAVPGAFLACLATAALVAASAPAKPTATTGGHMAGLQNDLDALVAAGAPERSCSSATETTPRRSRPASPTSHASGRCARPIAFGSPA